MRSKIRTMTRSSALRRALVWAAQLVVFACSGVLAFLLRFDFSLPAGSAHSVLFALEVWILTKVVVFRVAKLDRGLWEYVTIFDIVRLALGNLAASAASCTLILFLGPKGFSRSVFVLDLLICFTGTAGIRVAMRVVRNLIKIEHSDLPRRRSLVYGAGYAGVALVAEIRNNPRLGFEVCGFIDDQTSKRGLRVAGIPVLGGGEDLKRVAREQDIETILIAVPSATGTQMIRILGLCHAAGVDCKTVPGLGEIIEGKSFAGQIRDVAVQDLLGRTQVHLEESKIRTAIENKVVLVTGAAGSIGSELCRQIARYRPASIVGFEIAESPLFELAREIKHGFPNVPFYPEIGSIQNYARLDEVFRRHKPLVVYHAAAYKHVPLMETHVFEAIQNNVFGTYNVAQASAENGVADFVMISSDKAVCPTSVMGATKRVAELLLLSLQNGGTQYVAVRFGNVLGSNGSVIPIFKKQIAAGGPITVTHPEMRRFFMTIPEACQLVLQASAIGKGGQICVLDMGQPVKIVDLARNLILLSGLKPDEDIKIEFTGMRPGEKLYEELSSLLEDTVPTCHEKIRIFVGNGIPVPDTQAWLRLLQEICASRDTGRLVVTLKEIVMDYNPSADLLKRAIEPSDLNYKYSHSY